MKGFQKIFAIAFIACIVLPFGGILIRGEVKILESEKRLARQFPILGSSIESLKIQSNDYVDDQLLFRNEMVWAKSMISHRLFNSSPFPNKVILGKNNWLFYNTENNIETYRGDTLYSEQYLSILVQILKEKQVWLSQGGIEFYLMINPSKPEIYEEFLPDYIKRNEGSTGRCIQLVEYVRDNTSIPVIYARNELLKEKKNREIYLPFDSHWNTYGARVAYSVLIDSIRKKFPIIPPGLQTNEVKYITVTKNDFDLNKLMNLPNRSSMQIEIPNEMKYSQAKRIDSKQLKEVSIFHNEYFENSDTTLPKMLMFRDSYAVDLIPYLNCHFSSATYIWTPLFYPDLIQEEKPDIVILEVTERFISDLFIPNPSLEPPA